MTPRGYMLIGGFGGPVICVLALFLPYHPATAILAFSFGALFGKGYGIWEK